MPRPLSATIHTSALANNLAVARRYAPKSKIWAVVKANAYGHGLARAFPGLRATDGFGLLDLEEAVKLRELGWAGPILLLEGFFRPTDIDVQQRFRDLGFVADFKVHAKTSKPRPSRRSATEQRA